MPYGIAAAEDRLQQNPLQLQDTSADSPFTTAHASDDQSDQTFYDVFLNSSDYAKDHSSGDDLVMPLDNDFALEFIAPYPDNG
jgi:hypothetical protein